MRWPWGLFDQEHPDAWQIEVWPGHWLPGDRVEDDVLVKVYESGWAWSIKKNGQFVTCGDAGEMDDALAEAHLALKMLRLP